MLSVNVKESPYNAKGDGLHDDTISIQSAIDAANGGEVYFPQGNYRITSTLSAPKNTKLIGDGE